MGGDINEDEGDIKEGNIEFTREQSEILTIFLHNFRLCVEF